MKIIKIFAIALSIIALACVIAGILIQDPPREGQILAQSQIEVPCYIYHNILIDRLFTEPIEIGVFVFKDLHIFVFTNQLDGAIFYPDVVSIFKKFNLKLEDCILHIHNHLNPSGFSLADKKFATYLRDHGFKGQIALYISPTKEVKYLK